jgi:hypothetical protein
MIMVRLFWQREATNAFIYDKEERTLMPLPLLEFSPGLQIQIL